LNPPRKRGLRIPTVKLATSNLPPAPPPGHDPEKLPSGFDPMGDCSIP
jgi:hypothetical protein